MELTIHLCLTAIVVVLLPAVRESFRREMARGRYWF
jgi:hypothetical protein